MVLQGLSKEKVLFLFLLKSEGQLPPSPALGSDGPPQQSSLRKLLRDDVLRGARRLFA